MLTLLSSYPYNLHLCFPDGFYHSPLFPSNALSLLSTSLIRRRLCEDVYALSVSARGVVVRVNCHVNVPLVGLEEFKVEPGEKGGDAHVELSICKTK